MISFENWINLNTRDSIMDSTESLILKEGLISSYPIQMFRKFIQSVPGFVDMGPIFDTSSFNVLFDIGYRSQSDFIEYMNSKVYTYGYFIGTFKNVKNNQLQFSLEMKFPTIISKKDVEEYPWYHITNSQYVDKILKKGLGPRQSTTRFNHSGNVTYIIQVSDYNIPTLITLSKDLYYNKLAKLKEKGDKRRILNMENSQMKILKLYLPEDAIVRYDPSCGRNSNYRAGFLSNYIPPSNIELTDIL